jgi:hypothetical protein
MKSTAADAMRKIVGQPYLRVSMTELKKFLNTWTPVSIIILLNEVCKDQIIPTLTMWQTVISNEGNVQNKLNKMYLFD